MNLDPFVAWVDRVAPQHLGRRDRTGPALAADVRRLSKMYTTNRAAIAQQADPMAARMRFFFLRDLPKAAITVQALLRRGALDVPDTARILDLGSGLGTTSIGVSAVLPSTKVDVTAIEQDGASVAAHRALIEGARGEIPTTTLSPHAMDIRAIPPGMRSGPWDLILLGLSLNELWRGDPDRIARRADWLRSWLPSLSDRGAILIVEPALKATSRDLQQVRAQLTSHVSAPCTHAGSCPLLTRDRDWCHAEDRAPLHPTLQPIAKAAGLRFERLTWAPLVLQKTPARAAGHRIVGGPIMSKGRTDWHACGHDGLVAIGRLDRHRTRPDPLDGMSRGDLVSIGSVPDSGKVRTDKVPVERQSS